MDISPSRGSEILRKIAVQFDCDLEVVIILKIFVQPIIFTIFAYHIFDAKYAKQTEVTDLIIRYFGFALEVGVQI